MKYFTSDLHLGHEHAIKFGNRPFETVEEMNSKIIDNLKSVLSKGDDLYMLGDLAFRKYALDEFFDSLPKGVRFHWILGNHDRQWRPFRDRCESIDYMKEIKIDGNTVVMNHNPMLTWNKSHYNSWMLFGHHHVNSFHIAEFDKIIRGKMLNVNLEFNNFMPYSEIDIKRIMESKPDNWDYIKKAGV